MAFWTLSTKIVESLLIRALATQTEMTTRLANTTNWFYMTNDAQLVLRRCYCGRACCNWLWRCDHRHLSTLWRCWNRACKGEVDPVLPCVRTRPVGLLTQRCVRHNAFGIDLCLITYAVHYTTVPRLDQELLALKISLSEWTLSEPVVLKALLCWRSKTLPSATRAKMSWL